MDIIDDLKYRGLINQVSDEEALREALKKPMTFYCGFDPTANSLHAGNLLVIVIMMRLQKAGHHPIALVGGGTGMIGDPSGRSTERQLNTKEVVQSYADSLKKQLDHFLHFNEGNATFANNAEWLNELSTIEFLRDVGKYFTLNYMLSKDSVQTRLESGISFTEFSYMLLQSFDYLNLYEKKGCRMQIGGSDQWGNITAGLELIRKRGHEEHAFAMTFPLITKSDGTKFGKSMGGAIWLDPERTTPYEWYQFWINASDDDVVNFLKYFTFLTKDEIETLAKEVAEHPEERKAQKTLAREMTILVHGEEALKQAEHISQALFSGKVAQLSGAEIKQGFKDVPTYQAPRNEPVKLLDLLVEAGVTSSKRQAREDITNGAIYINGVRRTDLQDVLTEEDRVDNTYIIVRRGKKKYTLIQF
ncbi:tyrosine--tRNA ligase [Sporolactobacillus terrae]|uniref:Tyrosine--tRNA ligase n=1 Tax=Sporolactobacillus terrae TaxID=269673 RepID=A0A410D7V6_9BACL|nr:tyrosine--tRNA ligase [Sporolactobacillus terrae]QAA22198.1 tyrosine--tRNA ligase [Sporolactobacillus terrae]QAA25172.1 tyrosine--tRNA ligase [Sporolactobacillus terrae]UAK16992.1 tyrosine--tRNA ligase [Sporolactobacillus terrae]BBN98509.1 tyrosine--tRNA ligase 1 [Sporolactobacillus terrae]